MKHLRINSFELNSASKGTVSDFTTYMLVWKSAWNTKFIRRSIWKRETGASFQHATTHRWSTIGEKHRLGYIFINQLTNSSTLRPLRCGACCKNPSAYPSAWTHTSPVVGSCFIYKLGMLTGQRFQAELSPSFLWKFTEFRAETPPHAFGIPNCVTPPRLRNSSPRNPPLSLGIPRCRPWYGMDIFWNHPMLKLLTLWLVPSFS